MTKGFKWLWIQDFSFFLTILRLAPAFQLPVLNYIFFSSLTPNNSLKIDISRVFAGLAIQLGLPVCERVTQAAKTHKKYSGIIQNWIYFYLNFSPVAWTEEFEHFFSSWPQRVPRAGLKLSLSISIGALTLQIISDVAVLKHKSWAMFAAGLVLVDSVKHFRLGWLLAFLPDGDAPVLQLGY